MKTNLLSFLLGGLAFLSIGCRQDTGVKIEPNKDIFGSTYVIELDSCEYIYYQSDSRGSVSHKGNCKYCQIRNSK